jgi:hypothetical protein
LKPTEFAHPSEEEFARLLDFFRIEWLYEPQSFPLKQEGERVIEMFTPDFYLPDLNLYIELTTLKQNLMTEKHHKLRQLKNSILKSISSSSIRTTTSCYYQSMVSLHRTKPACRTSAGCSSATAKSSEG